MWETGRRMTDNRYRDADTGVNTDTHVYSQPGFRCNQGNHAHRRGAGVGELPFKPGVGNPTSGIYSKGSSLEMVGPASPVWLNPSLGLCDPGGAPPPPAKTAFAPDSQLPRLQPHRRNTGACSAQ